MRIEILGTGCPKCKALKKHVYNALAELDIAAEVSEVNDPAAIAERVTFTPALVVNGEVVFEGKVPPYERVREELKKRFGNA